MFCFKKIIIKEKENCSRDKESNPRPHSQSRCSRFYHTVTVRSGQAFEGATGIGDRHALRIDVVMDEDEGWRMENVNNRVNPATTR